MKNLKNSLVICEMFNILSIYGGQSYDPQIRALKKGVQIVVGTPGRVMDHMRRGTFKIRKLKDVSFRRS